MSQVTQEPINQQIWMIQESATIALADKVQKVQASGKKVFAMQTGDPVFATPRSISNASLRKAIAARFRQDDNLGQAWPNNCSMNAMCQSCPDRSVDRAAKDSCD